MRTLDRRPMTGQEFSAQLGWLGLTHVQAAAFLGCTDRTITRYVNDKQRVPLPIAMLLRSLVKAERRYLSSTEGNKRGEQIKAADSDGP